MHSTRTFTPIVIFTYRRTIDKLIESLQNNHLAPMSDLYIFSDGYKSQKDKEDVLAVRESLKKIEGFKNITLYESEYNKGLASSIIHGVSTIINQYEKIIVLEDDLIVSNNFLDYMNDALDFYQDNHSIWSISGYSPKLECLQEYQEDIYLSYRCNSWGWSTWKSRWDKIDWDIKDWKSFKDNKQEVNQFNIAGNDMYAMLEAQMSGKIDSWAIRWCYNQFKYNSYTIYPKESKIQNFGFDSKGTHNNDGMSRWYSTLSNQKVDFKNITLDEKIVNCFRKKYNLQFKTRIGYMLKKYGGYNFVKKLLKTIR
jgi:hypothetical protein